MNKGYVIFLSIFSIQVGGYTTPFVVLGSALFTTAVMTIFILPVHPNNSEATHSTIGKVLTINYYTREKIAEIQINIVNLKYFCRRDESVENSRRTDRHIIHNRDEHEHRIFTSYP